MRVPGTRMVEALHAPHGGVGEGHGGCRTSAGCHLGICRVGTSISCAVTWHRRCFRLLALWKQRQACCCYVVAVVVVVAVVCFVVVGVVVVDGFVVVVVVDFVVVGVEQIVPLLPSASGGQGG